MVEIIDLKAEKMRLFGFLVAFSVFIYNVTGHPPHIIFIVADDLGWNDIGWHNEQMYTPNLDKLAKEGVILDNSYVQPLCTPSRNCFMSGYYPYHTGLQHFVLTPMKPAFLPSNFTTLPQKLKELGYTTHMVGKWHLGFCNWKYTPTYRGFDSFMGYYNGMEDYYNHTREDWYDFRFSKSVFHPPENKYSAEIFADRAVDIINSLNPESQPLFLYLPFQSVHSPLEVPERFENIYKNISTKNRRAYCGMVSALDEAVGNITKALELRGFMKNALIVFTTDNGGPTWKKTGANNLPLRGGKSTLWEGGTRGAAFVYSKTLLKKTRYVNTKMIHAVDWFPTLLTVAGGVPDTKMDGRNQWPAISQNASSARNEFVYNIDEIDNNSAIRIGKYKLIQGDPGKPDGWTPLPPLEEQIKDDEPVPDFQLFDLENDPGEHNDIAKKHDDIVKILKSRLEFHRKTMVPANDPPDDEKADPKYYGGNWSPGWC